MSLPIVNKACNITTDTVGLSLSIGNLVTSYAMSIVDVEIQVGGKKNWVLGDINKVH